MKIAYFDCFSGISGNMTLGALIDLGIDIDFLKNELRKINLPGWDLKVEKIRKGAIRGTLVCVSYDKNTEKDRNLKIIEDLLTKSALSEKVVNESVNIFRKLAKAEAMVHNISIDKVHFHEVGAVDSIIDIAGCCICLDKLGISEVYSSQIQVGRGFVKCAHGILPIPAPATAELLRGVPVYSTGCDRELVTPTGAAIITNYAKKYGSMPLMKLNQIGYGANAENYEIPYLLRVFLGDKQV